MSAQIKEATIACKKRKSLSTDALTIYVWRSCQIICQVGYLPLSLSDYLKATGHHLIFVHVEKGAS